MMTERITAPAKINLRLRVLAREASGYHQIETLFACLRLADELEFDPGPAGLRLHVEGVDVGPVENNLVMRAAAAFHEATGRPPALDITLHKRIPAGAGLGGGSSDAAATLVALNRVHGDPCTTGTLLRLAAALGSDVPFFLAGAPFALAWGRGERCLRLDPPPDRPVLLGVPADAMSTAGAYAALDAATADAHPPEALPPAREFRTWRTIAGVAVNDFERLVLSRIPATRVLLDCFRDAGAIVARLSGTGSAVYGVFDSGADLERAARLAGARIPDAAFVRTATAFATDDALPDSSTQRREAQP